MIDAIQQHVVLREVLQYHSDFIIIKLVAMCLHSAKEIASSTRKQHHKYLLQHSVIPCLFGELISCPADPSFNSNTVGQQGVMLVIANNDILDIVFCLLVHEQ